MRLLWCLLLVQAVHWPLAETLVDTLYRRVVKHMYPEKDKVTVCLEQLVRYYTSRHKQMVFMIRDAHVDWSMFPRISTMRILPSTVIDIRYQKLIGVHVVSGQKKIRTVLQRIRWSCHTKFIVVLPRYDRDDDMYIEDLRHQDINEDGVLKTTHLIRDFENFISAEDNQHRLDVQRLTKKIFREFWAERIVNVGVIVPQKSRIYFYTYYPFTEINCPESLAPVLINVWFFSSKTFYQKINFFPEKNHNLHGCPVNISIVSSPPGVVQDEGNKVQGIEGEILMHIFQTINATPAFRLLSCKERQQNESITAMNLALEDIRTGISDFAAGLLIPTIEHSTITDDINFCVSVCLTWAVPSRAKSKTDLSPIVDIFTGSLWLLIACAVALSVFILRYLLHSTRRGKSGIFITCAFQIIEVFLGKNTRFPNQNSPRTFLIFFVWCSLILSTAYQARLGSDNILARPPEQLETTQEIIDSGMDITGVDSTVHLFDHEIRLVRKNGEQIQVQPMEIRKALTKVAFGRKTAYAGLRLAIKYYIRVLYPDLRRHVHISQTCLVQYHPFLAIRRNSPLSDRVNQIMFALIESGFKSKLERKYLDEMLKVKNKQPERKERPPLVMGALQIWMSGLILSFVAFLSENCIHHVCNPRRR